MNPAPLLALLLCSCAGGLHARGEHQAIAGAAVGIPAGGNLLWAGVDRDAPNAAVRAAYGTFTADRTAILGVALPYRYYDQDDGPVHAVELQALVRYYPPLEFQVGRLPVAPFVDAAVGVLHGSRAVPAGGTRTNITQEAGLGLELILSKRLSAFVGYHQRHLSNGRGGSAPDNPGYNDHQILFGVGWRW